MATQKVTNRDINYKFNPKTQEVTNKAPKKQEKQAKHMQQQGKRNCSSKP